MGLRTGCSARAECVLCVSVCGCGWLWLWPCVWLPVAVAVRGCGCVWLWLCVSLRVRVVGCRCASCGCVWVFVDGGTRAVWAGPDVVLTAGCSTRLVSLAAQSAAVGLLHQAKLEWQMILGAAGAKSKEGDLDAPFDMQLEHVLAAYVAIVGVRLPESQHVASGHAGWNAVEWMPASPSYFLIRACSVSRWRRETAQMHEVC